MLKKECVTLCLYEQSERWGDHKILRPLCRGDRKILYPFHWGDRKFNETSFGRFFRPPPPIVNELPLICYHEYSITNVNGSISIIQCYRFYYSMLQEPTLMAMVVMDTKEQGTGMEVHMVCEVYLYLLVTNLSTPFISPDNNFCSHVLSRGFVL